jgi:lipopolysaccharide export LptBFGC system permease protein LptF
MSKLKPFLAILLMAIGISFLPLGVRYLGSDSTQSPLLDAVEIIASSVGLFMFIIGAKCAWTCLD